MWSSNNDFFGKQGRGADPLLGSDLDKMFVLNSVICLEDGVNAFARVITVLRSLSSMRYHGHCRLLLERRIAMFPF
ncbi:hypothetical protein DPMN_069088 [Dreissena polymorpha]|uniref:Uncharacterized protein n=1 Tax=Dreissena polymorpha TaxID=45954 RepID=A0A9D4BUN6_DREPO|nr:hypothetical protein DPMN_069088 [Dreissena polymorpha]